MNQGQFCAKTPSTLHSCEQTRRRHVTSRHVDAASLNLCRGGTPCLDASSVKQAPPSPPSRAPRLHDNASRGNPETRGAVCGSIASVCRAWRATSAGDEEALGLLHTGRVRRHVDGVLRLTRCVIEWSSHPERIRCENGRLTPRPHHVRQRITHAKVTAHQNGSHVCLWLCSH